MERQTTAGAGPTAVVVGGGIAGLAAARALQLAGWSVQVLEGADRLDPVGAGISLWPNAVHALRVLGVLLPVPSTTPGVGGIRTARGRWLSRTRPATFPARYGAPLITVHRAQLQQALVASLAPDTVVTDAHVSAVRPRPGHVTLEHTRGAARADLVVLADGLASRTRPLVTGPRPRARYAGYTAWRGVTRPGIDAPDPGAATESWGRGQRFGIVPLVDGRTYWFATANAPEGQHAGDGEHAEVLRRFATWHPPIRQLLHATDPAGVLRHDVYDLRPHPTRYVRGRLVLIGDAAHAMTPNLGQGACQALEDAATLGLLLSAGGRLGTDLDTDLARYDALRRPRARSISTRSRQLGRVGQLSGGIATTARDLLVRAVPADVTGRRLDSTLSWRAPST